jgi:MFS family permease
MTMSDATLQLDQQNRYAVKALLASLAGNILDTFDNLLLGFLLVAISSELQLSRSEAGSIATATLIGAVVGGIVFGILSDYYAIIVFAVFTALCAFSVGYWDLLVYRTMAGLGIGGEWGIGMALVAEACPARTRARGLSFVGIGGPLGVHDSHYHADGRYRDPRRGFRDSVAELGRKIGG